MTEQHKRIDQHNLPLAEREQLCRSLLAEFGVTSIKHEAGRQELIHSCCLPFNGHRNGDRNPSASINYKKLTYKCLSGCGEGGLLWFIGICRETTGTQAREWLETQTGGGKEGYSLSMLLEILDSMWNPESQKPQPIPRMSARVLDPWRFIHPYLTDTEPPCRGIREENVLRLQIGWNPETDRIVIPHFWRGDLVGWQTRRISSKDPNRWLSSPEFPKLTTVYNHDSTRRHAVGVEACLSVAKHIHHIDNMEGTFGATITDPQLKVLANHERFTWWPDNDLAGWKTVEGRVEGKGRWAKKVPGFTEKLSAYTDVRVVQNPWAADPADMDDDAMVEELIEQAVPWPLWRRPTELLCLRCKQSHEGICAKEAA